ncbi:putative C2H2 finger domain protein [Aspergillus lucknowensis]|uniref:C2H2-type domain-containing protein n=1 Tax=Aspergillus lucknowensis TaxID=176173 RepID=A0ABR4LZR3_9EURO
MRGRIILATDVQFAGIVHIYSRSTLNLLTRPLYAPDMQSDLDHPDFILVPSQSSKDAKMMALESSRQHHAAYFQDFSIDPALFESFNFAADNLGGYGQHDSGMIQQTYQNTGFADSYTETAKSTGFPLMPITPPANPVSHSEPFFSGVSTASGPSTASASSSAMGSPYSANAHNPQEDWVDTNHGLGLPAAVMEDLFPNECLVNPFESDGFYPKQSDNFVDPSLIQPVQQSHLTPPTISYPDQSDYTLAHTGLLPQSPEPSQFHHAENYMLKQSFQQQSNLLPPSPSTMPSSSLSRPVSIYDRRSSISSIHSRRSQASPAASGTELDDETKEKGRCPHPECGRVFRDLKAHMLTHQSERPEKCPIVTCEYHTKGFARKYDKNRHTLTHYKGTMVCGFCPGSGSPAEKSFNRADVFKRHLTSVHGVEQTPPNCRKRSPAASSNKSVSDYCQDATGKCSTCSGTFSNAQDFYEHLDDCVLRVVQQEEPSEAINQQRLAEVEADDEVKKTMEKHKLIDAAGFVEAYDDENDDDDNDFDDRRPTKNTSKAGKGSRVILGNNNAVTKHSSNANNKGRITASKRRNNRDQYPQSWGCPSRNIKMKKRVLCVFDGQRRLWKDEMMLDNEFEVRLKLPGGASDGTSREAYVTDLDVETLKRANGILNASEEERGAWVDASSTQLIGQPAMLLQGFSQPHEGEVDIDELMA